MHGWTREFQDRGAYLTHYTVGVLEMTLSLPIYQSLPPLPAWPPLDRRKPASAVCLLQSSKQSWNTACSSLSSASGCAHQAASQASVPRCLLFAQLLGCCLFTSISVLSLVTPQSEQARPFLLCPVLLIVNMYLLFLLSHLTNTHLL